MEVVRDPTALRTIISLYRGTSCSDGHRIIALPLRLIHAALLQSGRAAELNLANGAGSVVGEGLRASEGHTAAHQLQYSTCGGLYIVYSMHHGTHGTMIPAGRFSSAY